MCGSKLGDAQREDARPKLKSARTSPRRTYRFLVYPRSVTSPPSHLDQLTFSQGNAVPSPSPAFISSIKQALANSVPTSPQPLVEAPTGAFHPACSRPLNSISKVAKAFERGRKVGAWMNGMSNVGQTPRKQSKSHARSSRRAIWTSRSDRLILEWTMHAKLEPCLI